MVLRVGDVGGCVVIFCLGVWLWRYGVDVEVDYVWRECVFEGEGVFCDVVGGDLCVVFYDWSVGGDVVCLGWYVVFVFLDWFVGMCDCGENFWWLSVYVFVWDVVWWWILLVYWCGLEICDYWGCGWWIFC